MKTTYPDSTFTQTTYDFRDKPLTVTDQLGRVTKNEYDLAGQLKKVTYAFGTADAASVEYTYDLAGRRLTEKDERGNVTTNAYDDAGRVVSVTNAQGKAKTFAYDDADRRTSSTDEKNRVTVFEFDGRGRNTKVTYPDTKFVTHAYDGLGLRTSTTDQDLRTTVWAYDKASQLTSVTNALSQITSYGYDLAGNKIRQTDANSHQTSYEYDALNRRTRRTLPAGQYESFTYDAVGNMLTRRNFNAKTTTHAYDSMNRLLSMTPDASLSGQTPITFTYSGTGKRLTMADASGTTTWTYDFRDRVKTKATPQGTLTYSYHPNSLVASVLSSNANGVNIAYGYDSLNRLQTVTDQAGATSLTWDDAGNPATMAYPNGVVHTFGTDVMDRMSGVTLTKTPNTLASHNYTFGNSGQRLTATESGGRSMSWGYDAVYKLTSEAIVPEGNVTYGLDAVGNRLSRTSTIAAIPSTTNTFDLNDRISGDTFDDNGNTLTSGGKTFGYDFLDRLTSYNGGAVTMVYDGDGNRIAKTAGGVTTRYLVDDLTPTGYAQVAEEVIAGSVVRRYTHGTVRISQTASGATHYYGYDGGLHVRSLSDVAGAVTDTFAYDAFGNSVARTGTTANEYLYRGEQYDSALGMYYLRARWYVPQFGRFLTADTYQGTPWRPISLQKFLYAHADPVGQTDPSGHGIFNWSTVAGFFGPGYVAAQKVGEFSRGLLSLGTYTQKQADLIGTALEFLKHRAEFIGEATQELTPQTGRMTAAAAQVIDKAGNVLQVVSISGRHMTTRFADAVLAPFEIPIYGAAHAEANIIRWARDAGYKVISIASSRGICLECELEIMEQEARQGLKIFVGTRFRGY